MRRETDTKTPLDKGCAAEWNRKIASDIPNKNGLVLIVHCKYSVRIDVFYYIKKIREKASFVLLFFLCACVQQGISVDKTVYVNGTDPRPTVTEDQIKAGQLSGMPPSSASIIATGNYDGVEPVSPVVVKMVDKYILSGNQFIGEDGQPASAEVA